MEQPRSIEVEVEARAADGAHDSTYLLFLMPSSRRAGQLGEAVGDGLSRSASRSISSGIMTITLCPLPSSPRSPGHPRSRSLLACSSSRGQEALVHQREMVGVGGVLELDLQLPGKVKRCSPAPDRVATGCFMNKSIHFFAGLATR